MSVNDLTGWQLDIPDASPEFGGAARFVLSAVTAAPAQTVTLQRITPTGGDVRIVWGDGNADIISDGETGATTHEYAAAGTYGITISQPDLITYLDIRDAQIGCAAGQIGALTNLTALILRTSAALNVAAGEIETLTNLVNFEAFSVANVVVSAGEIGLLTNLTRLVLGSGTGIVVGAGEIGLLTNLTYFDAQAAPTITVGAGEIGLLTNLTTLRLVSDANITIGAGEIDNLTALTFLRLHNIPNATVGAAEVGLLTLLTSLHLEGSANIAVQTGLASCPALISVVYKNNMAEGEVDGVLEDLYDAFPTRTGVNGAIDVAGTNAAPSGTLQAQCVPVDGKEFAYELVNDSCAVATNHWATVTIN